MHQSVGPDGFELIVVDDGSTDATSAVCQSFFSTHLMLSATCVRQANGGVNAARNAGVRASRGRIVVFLDDDELAPRDHLERIVGVLGHRLEVAGVGGPARLDERGAFRTCPSCSIGDAKLPIEGVGDTPRLLGGNMAIRRSVFDEVGLFDPEISGRGDETEWFERAKRTFLYDESLFVWHRRDHMSLFQLLRTGFRQGRSVPLLHEKTGHQEWRPSPVKAARYVGHALRRRCVNGLLQAARELGSIWSWTGRKLTRRSRATV